MTGGADGTRPTGGSHARRGARRGMGEGRERERDRGRQDAAIRDHLCTTRFTPSPGRFGHWYPGAAYLTPDKAVNAVHRGVTVHFLCSLLLAIGVLTMSPPARLRVLTDEKNRPVPLR